MSLTDAQAARLLTDLPEPLFIMSGEGRITFFNRAAEAQTGYGADEMIGEHVTRLLPQSERRRVDVVAWLERWARDPNPDQLRHLNLTGVSKSGEERLYRVRVSSFADEGQTRYLVVLRDVTDEHEEIAGLRHGQLVANRIIAIGEDAVLSIDAEQRITFWNAAAEKLFGYTHDEIVGKPLGTLLPANLDPVHTEHIREFIRSKEATKMMGERGEIFGRCRDGSLVPLEASLTKTWIGDRLVMSAQVRDISERKCAEEALRESELRFRAVFDNAFEAIVLLKPDGDVLEINRAAMNMLPPDEVTTGKSFWQLNWWNAEDTSARQESAEGLKSNVMRARQGETVRLRTELDSREGQTRHVDFSLIPVSEAEGRVLYIIAEGRDITDIGQ